MSPREGPILFSAPMIIASLERKKTQTRRVIDHQPDARGLWPRGTPPGFADCPYARAPGDRLWTRETWRTAKSLDGLSPTQIEEQARANGCDHGPFAPVLYVADGMSLTADIPEGGWGKTRVSIHMPRWASRLTLEVTEVRVQRLQDISEEDAKAEGVGESAFVHPGNADVWAEHAHERYRLLFHGLWEKINGARKGCAWKDNPWVWAVSFRVLEKGG